MQKQKITQKDWSIKTGEAVSIGDFNNVTDVANFGFYPGQRGDGAHVMLTNPEATVETVKYNPEDYAFSVQRSGYFYGIKEDYSEVMGIFDNGDIIPVTEGAGGFRFGSRGNSRYYVQTGVKGFKLCEVDGYEAITVTYTGVGENSGCSEETTYIFKENCITTVSRIRVMGMAEDFRDPGFVRKHINTPSIAKNRVAYETIQHDNGEHPYKDVESYVVSEQFGNKTFFSFVKAMAGEKVRATGHGINAFPVPLAMGIHDVDLTYTVDYAVTEADGGEAYFGLFKGRGMDFAAGVVSVDKNDNTTFFRGLETVLNINVTNISENDINFSVKYNIMNHYNEEVAAHTYLNNELKAGEAANRNIPLSFDKYGMYYLNLYVTSENYEYREIYTFAMYEDYEYKYRKESPFGICETHHESIEHEYSLINALNGIGVSLVRAAAATTNEFLDRMYNAGLTRFAMGNTAHGRAEPRVYPKPEGMEGYKNGIRGQLGRYGHRIDYFLTNNENDSPSKANYEKATKFLKEFVKYTYTPAYEVISEEFPDVLKKTIWQSNCHGTTEWLEAFYETGMWDNSEIIDIHSYSSPSGPDKCFSNTYASMHANTFSNEYAMERWERAKRRYGEKRMIVGETGYPAPPPCGDLREIDYRTQADFNTRIVLFLLAGGAEDIIFYSLLDRPTYFVGTGKWNEMYFGAFHNYDYYGVYMPKAWAAAYANVTRRFDGYTECKKNPLDESEFGTLRAFDVKTKENGDFTVLWSNIYKQPNTTAEGRVNNVERLHMELWESRWLETETREFDAKADVVKVVDLMGNVTEHKAVDGKVSLEISGSPMYVYGI